jgi:uncharacterized membrane protein
MASFGVRLVNGIVGSAIAVPFVATGGALCGFIYAKLADLPAGQVAKAWAIWNAAESALMTMIATFTENKTTQAFIRATVLTISTIIGMNELQKRDLIGPKMTVFLIAIRALGVFGIIAREFVSIPESDAEV